jgi:hypothetical protein
MAGGYNAYAAIVLPSGEIKLLDAQGYKHSYQWATLNEPLASFMRNISLGDADRAIRLQIIRDLDIATMCPVRAYVGYGLSLEETIRSGRYRGIYALDC